MSFLPSMPSASLLDIFKKYPELASLIHVFAERLMRGESPLSAGERELIAAYVSGLNGCDYCRASHGAVAERFGVSADALEGLLDDLEGAAVSEKLRPVLRYAYKLNQTPDQVGQGDVDAILEAGWDETAVVHTALVCGFFNLMNRWVDGLGLKADPAIVEMAAKQLHARGYGAISDLLQGQTA